MASSELNLGGFVNLGHLQPDNWPDNLGTLVARSKTSTLELPSARLIFAQDAIGIWLLRVPVWRFGNMPIIEIAVVLDKGSGDSTLLRDRRRGLLHRLMFPLDANLQTPP